MSTNGYSAQGWVANVDWESLRPHHYSSFDQRVKPQTERESSTYQRSNSDPLYQQRGTFVMSRGVGDAVSDADLLH